MTKETILVINRGYLPGTQFGGPVTSIQNFCDSFYSEYNIKIITWDHDFGDKTRYSDIDKGWNEIGNAEVLYLSDRECSYSTFVKIITEEHPILCYLSGTITSYFGFNDRVLKACKSTKTPVIIAPRGDICSNALKLKKFKKSIAIYYCKSLSVFSNYYFQITIDEEKQNLQKLFNIREERIFDIPNIPATIKPEINKDKISGEADIIFLSRITKKKNLLDAIKSVNQTSQTIKFDIYGPIEDEQYWDCCCEEIKLAPRNVKISYKGPLDTEEAKNIFKKYDAFIFETLSENYGHVIIESLLCGCPVILSKGTTPWDDLNSEAGFVVELGQHEEYAKRIDYIANLDYEDSCKFRANTYAYAEKKIDLCKLLDDYRKMFDRVKKETY